jgi:hypothetical protein
MLKLPNKSLFIIVALLTLSSLSQFLLAQESLLAPTAQAQLLRVKNTPSHLKGSKSNVLLQLPFIEDFSAPIFYPDSTKWISKSVFVNRSYAVNPPSIGVATFDAMDSRGHVYPSMTSFTSPADTLLSKPIRLDSLKIPFPYKLKPSDSIYFSFFFQPQGLGAQPNEGDSLVLQFYNPTFDRWKSVWNHKGMSLDSFRVHYDTSFQQVLIAIVDTQYFKSNFQFRFVNYAHLPAPEIPSWRSGLHCHWNVDYIVLDKSRNLYDTSYNDIAILNYLTTALKDYQSIPWNQYQAAGPSAMINFNKGIYFRNMDDVLNSKSVDQYLYIFDLYTKDTLAEANPIPATVPVASQVVAYYKPDHNFSSYISNSPYPEFRVLYRIFTNSPPPDIISANDTMAFYQNFYNYMAFDDGTAEAGYGLSVNGGKVALQFEAFEPDTLRSVMMYFNQTITAASQQYFYLTIWGDNNGKPGNIIYEQSGRKPEYEDELFAFHTYVLNEPIGVAGKFYIGWRQTTKDNLNIGFDFNNNQNQKLFTNTSGSWVNSVYEGCPMIRPILGTSEYAHVGIEKPKSQERKLTVYPNPSNGRFFLKFAQSTALSEVNIDVFNIQGQRVFSQQNATSIDLSHLANGVYYLQLVSPNQWIENHKIVIQK